MTLCRRRWRHRYRRPYLWALAGRLLAVDAMAALTSSFSSHSDGWKYSSQKLLWKLKPRYINFSHASSTSSSTDSAWKSLVGGRSNFGKHWKLAEDARKRYEQLRSEGFMVDCHRLFTLWKFSVIIHRKYCMAFLYLKRIYYDLSNIFFALFWVMCFSRSILTSFIIPPWSFSSRRSQLPNLASPGQRCKVDGWSPGQQQHIVDNGGGVCVRHPRIIRIFLNITRIICSNLSFRLLLQTFIPLTPFQSIWLTVEFHVVIYFVWYTVIVSVLVWHGLNSPRKLCLA